MSSDVVSSTGLTGGFWAPIPYSWPYPSRKRAERETRKARRWRLLASVVGRIDVFLSRSKVEKPGEGAAGWLANNLRLFEKQTERYSIKEFVERYSKFLSDTRLRNVLLIELDYAEVYSDRVDKEPDDLDEALAEASKHVPPQEKGNKVLFATFGRTDHGLKNDLELTVEAQYYRRHGEGKPSVEIRVLGVPSVFVRQRGEGGREYKARMRGVFRELRTDASKARFARKYENTAEFLIRDYEKRLRRVFDVAKTTRWLHLTWGTTEQDVERRKKF